MISTRHIEKLNTYVHWPCYNATIDMRRMS